MQTSINPLVCRFGCTLFTSLILAACGGGGGGAPPASDPAGATPPALTLSTATPGRLRFSWSGGAEVSEYRLKESTDGGTTYEVVASFPPEHLDHEIVAFLPAKMPSRYLVEACDAGDCLASAPVVVADSLQYEATRLGASNAHANLYLGYSLALSGDGNTLAVGAYKDDNRATGVNSDVRDYSVESAGAVYVYRRDEAGQWELGAYLKPNVIGPWDRFGFHLALSTDGNTLAVGALYEDSNAIGVNGDADNDLLSDTGAVYVFAHDGGTWAQQAYLKASNPSWGDQFGYHVALSGDGNTLAVGAINEDSAATGIDGDQSNGGALESGAVYVFTRSDDTWAQQAYVKAANTGAGDLFGHSLALSANGRWLAVSAPNEDSAAPGGVGSPDDNTVTDSGAVYVFGLDGDTWTQQAYLKASNAAPGDQFGYHLALSANGQTLAVSAVGEDSGATGVDGGQTSDTVEGSGAVYVFTQDDTTWTQQAYLKASNPGTGDQFGISVALSDDGLLLAVGARWEDSEAHGINQSGDNEGSLESGAAYVFGRNDGQWTQQAFVKATEPGAQTWGSFGFSVDLAGNGSRLAVGAPGEDTNYYDTGSVYVY